VRVAWVGLVAGPTGLEPVTSGVTAGSATLWTYLARYANLLTVQGRSAIGPLDGPAPEWPVLDEESPQKPPHPPEARPVRLRGPDHIRREDLSRILLEIQHKALPPSEKPRSPPRPLRGPARWWFISDLASEAIRTLAHLQSDLRALPEPRARERAREFIHFIRKAAPRKHFPYRRDYGTDRETAPWYLVLFHGADPLPLLRDGSPFINGHALVAAMYGLSTAHVLGAPHFADPPRRGPNRCRLKPYFTCALDGRRITGTPRTLWLCPECLALLRQMPPLTFSCDSPSGQPQ